MWKNIFTAALEEQQVQYNRQDNGQYDGYDQTSHTGHAHNDPTFLADNLSLPFWLGSINHSFIGAAGNHCRIGNRC